jgi:hypothetical protein
LTRQSIAKKDFLAKMASGLPQGPAGASPLNRHPYAAPALAVSTSTGASSWILSAAEQQLIRIIRAEHGHDLTLTVRVRDGRFTVCMNTYNAGPSAGIGYEASFRGRVARRDRAERGQGGRYPRRQLLANTALIHACAPIKDPIAAGILACERCACLASRSTPASERKSPQDWRHAKPFGSRIGVSLDHISIASKNMK